MTFCSNARHQARQTAEARHERTLFAVACMPLLGEHWHRVRPWHPCLAPSSHDRPPNDLYVLGLHLPSTTWGGVPGGPLRRFRNAPA
jgi:hypothetical protein